MKKTMPRMMWCIVFLLGLSASSGSEEVVLRYQWTLNEEIHLEKSLELAGTIRMGTEEALPISQRAQIRKRVQADEIGAAGQAKLTVAPLLLSATRSIANEVVHYVLSPQEAEIDGLAVFQRDDPKFKDIRTWLETIYRPRVMWCTPLGRTDSPALPRAIREGSGRSDLFSLFGIGEEGWIPLPEQPVQVGDSWSDEPPAVVQSGTSEVWYRYDLTLTGLEQNDSGVLAHIAFQLERQHKNLDLQFSPRPVRGKQIPRTGIVETRQSFTGTVLFDVSRGRVLRCEAQGNAVMTYLVSGFLLYHLPSPPVEYQWTSVNMTTEWK